MKEVYIILEINWEYNDSIFLHNGKNGYPKSFFSSEEVANLRCEELNLLHFKEIVKDNDLRSYVDIYSYSKSLSYDDLDFIKNIGFNSFDDLIENDDSNQTLNQLTDDQFKILFKIFDFTFFEVVKVINGGELENKENVINK